MTERRPSITEIERVRESHPEVVAELERLAIEGFMWQIEQIPDNEAFGGIDKSQIRALLKM